jgi:hypothetical protein
MDMTLKEALLTEIETLPEARQADVLAYVRFIKIGLADPATLEHQFTEALNRARLIAAQCQITDADIEAEVQAVRAGQ